MKVTTFRMGTADTLDSAFKRLDQMISSLGKIRIHSVTDTMTTMHGGSENDVPSIIRVVVYEPLT